MRSKPTRLPTDLAEQLAYRARAIARFKGKPGRLPTDLAEQLAYRAGLIASFDATETAAAEGAGRVSSRRPRRPSSRQHRTARDSFIVAHPFEAKYGGEIVRLGVGERVVSEHELVARYHPQNFQPAK